MFVPPDLCPELSSRFPSIPPPRTPHLSEYCLPTHPHPCWGGVPWCLSNNSRPLPPPSGPAANPAPLPKWLPNPTTFLQLCCPGSSSRALTQASPSTRETVFVNTDQSAQLTASSTCGLSIWPWALCPHSLPLSACLSPAEFLLSSRPAGWPQLEGLLLFLKCSS